MDTTWSRTTRILVLIFILIGLIWLASLAAPLWQALSVSALLAYLLDPVVRFTMQRFHLSRAWACRLVVAVFFLLLAGIPAALGALLFNQLPELRAAIAEIVAWLSRPIHFLGLELRPQAWVQQAQASIARALNTLPSGSLNILSSVTTNLLWTAVVLGTIYWFLKDGPQIKFWLLDLVPEAHRPELSRLIDEVDKVWGRFLRVQVIMFFVIAILTLIGVLITLALFRTGLLEWSWLGFILVIAAIYTIIQQLDNFWWRPQFLGRELRLHPGVVFAGLLGALALSGILGTIIVVPAIASARVIGRYVHRKLLGLPPWPEEPAPSQEVPQETEEASRQAS